MDNVILLIDGGTTNTRFTLMRGDTMLERRTANVGASGADAMHRNPLLRAAVLSAMEEMPKTHQGKLSLVCISGMITSENGLVCVPHLAAPAGKETLAGGIFRTFLPEMPQIPVWCIPGVRTLDGSTVVDMMRGEETEIMGDLDAHPGAGNRLYLHFGSHNKAIYVEGGKITGSKTTISGELFAASVQHTILSTSAGRPDDAPLDAGFVLDGFREALSKGLPGAMFRARMCAVMEGASPVQVRSFLYGALTQQDAMCFRPMLEQHPEEIVIYGREQPAAAWQICMQGMLAGAGFREISYEESELMSIRGACSVLHYLLKEDLAHE